jgi:two-component system sensor histidine kinase SenX3
LTITIGDNLGYELKTPSTSLRLLAESLVDILEEDPEQARFFAEQLKNETERLAQLITDLLDLARLESEEGVQNPVPVDIRSVLMVVLSRLRPPAKRTSPSPGNALAAPPCTPSWVTRRS